MKVLVECTPEPIAAQTFRMARLMLDREVGPGVAADCAATGNKCSVLGVCAVLRQSPPCRAEIVCAITAV